MADKSGLGEKVMVVTHYSLTSHDRDGLEYEELPQQPLQPVKHFFQSRHPGACSQKDVFLDMSYTVKGTKNKK